MSSLVANLSISSIAFVFAGLALAGIIKGATGLGYASTALPFLVHAVGLNTGKALVLLPAMATNIAVAFGNGYLRETCHDYSALYLAMLPGIGAGLLLLAHIEAGVAVKSLGVTILVYSILSLLRPRLVLTPPAAARLQVPVGLANGLLTGLTGSQVLPMVPYFLALDLEPKRMVQAINLGVTLASAILLGGLLLSGQAPLLVLRASALAIVPALAGVEIGQRLQRHINPSLLRSAILVVLGLAGAGLLLR
ncbi:MAG: sulfite exporter TauE/SafE family protein [Caldilineaceae bacterium]|nr:sulfite exporter TauE/SafE family protein [Caldilineaceae bacterium]